MNIIEWVKSLFKNSTSSTTPEPEVTQPISTPDEVLEKKKPAVKKKKTAVKKPKKTKGKSK